MCPLFLAMFFILELTVRYETNLRNIIKRKQDWYKDFIKKQKKRDFKSVDSLLFLLVHSVFYKKFSAFVKMV